MVDNTSISRSRRGPGGLVLSAVTLLSVAALALGQPSATPGSSAAPITTTTLLGEMTDLNALTRFPDPPFTCRQFSSYDRRSTSPSQGEAAGDGWFANGDANQYLRVELNEGRTEHVLMDTKGPGAVVRIWSANPKGNLRFYLDGKSAAAWEVPMMEFLGGQVPLVPEPITGMRSRGWNSYLPIPYAQSCKITCDTNDFYYHVNYRTYPAGTAVRTFDPAELTEAAGLVAETARKLAMAAATGRTEDPSMTPEASRSEITLQAGQTQVVREWTGPSAISELSVRVAADTPEEALRRTILTMTFDGQTTVACPLGDFFGAAPGINPYESLPMGVALDGTMWSHWRMPFREKATLSLQNLTGKSLAIDFGADTIDYTWDDRSLYFHCKWRAEYAVPTRPFRDWNYLDAKGRGVFVGAAFNVANPVRHWWGEGDEKIYVDGETFPSTFGTGTEDYYGYAWCYNRPFTHAYHAQPRCDGPANRGYTANNRWHILDSIPFTSSFRFDMEFWHWHEKAAADLAIAAYWYADKDATDSFSALSAENVRLNVLPPYEIVIVEGAIEGEHMRVVSKSGEGYYTPNPVERASRDEVGLWHHGRKIGDQISLGFNAPKAGSYRVLARYMRNLDLATVKLAINDVPVADPQNSYHPEVALSEEVLLGVFSLREGENVLAVEITGADERAVPRYNWALDYLRLEPAE